MNKNKIINSFDELLNSKYGKVGNPKREEFEKKAQYFIISEMLKDSRKKEMRYSAFYFISYI